MNAEPLIESTNCVGEIYTAHYDSSEMLKRVMRFYCNSDLFIDSSWIPSGFGQSISYKLYSNVRYEKNCELLEKLNVKGSLSFYPLETRPLLLELPQWQSFILVLGGLYFRHAFGRMIERKQIDFFKDKLGQKNWKFINNGACLLFGQLQQFELGFRFNTDFLVDRGYRTYTRLLAGECMDYLPILRFRVPRITVERAANQFEFTGAAPAVSKLSKQLFPEDSWLWNE